MTVVDNKNVVVRIAKHADAAAICQLLRESIRAVCALDYGNDEAVLTQWLHNKTPENVIKWINANHCCYVACQDGAVVGFVLMDDEGHLLLNYLLPQYFRQGIGTVLLREVECYAADHSIHTITVDSTITAKEFYLKQGFVANGAPNKVANYLGEFPLRKSLTVSEDPVGPIEG